MEEESAEVIRVTRRNMDDMEDKAAEMARDIRRKTHCMKAEMKKVKACHISVFPGRGRS